MLLKIAAEVTVAALKGLEVAVEGSKGVALEGLEVAVEGLTGGKEGHSGQMIASAVKKWVEEE